MADMQTKTTTNIRFSKHEVYSVNINNSSHSPSITIMTSGNDTVEMTFSDRDSMNNILGAMVKAWITIDRSREYSSGYSYINDEDDRVSYEKILEWKAAAERMTSINDTLDALKPLSDQS